MNRTQLWPPDIDARNYDMHGIVTNIDARNYDLHGIVTARVLIEIDFISWKC